MAKIENTKRIVLTGGGTAGHVTPNIALMEGLEEAGYEIHYIGSYTGIEKDLVSSLVPYYGISSGKLRRYFDLKNFTDPFRVVKGCFQASALIKKIKPQVIFSKGGFVSVPIILAGKLNRVPTIIHESDMTPGLANRLSIPFASHVCTTFSETLQHIPKDKGVLTGTPIRKELFSGEKEKGLTYCGFTADKPVIMMMGGSLGSKRINEVLRESLPQLLKKYQLVHLCGKGNLDPSLEGLTGYKQFEYVKENLPHIFAMTDLVISRAGANSISELLALKKANILIPLPLAQSRGDQILNAESFKSHGYSTVLMEEDLTASTLLNTIDEVHKKRKETLSIMSASKSSDGVQNILKLIKDKGDR